MTQQQQVALEIATTQIVSLNVRSPLELLDAWCFNGSKKCQKTLQEQKK